MCPILEAVSIPLWIPPCGFLRAQNSVDGNVRRTHGNLVGDGPNRSVLGRARSLPCSSVVRRRELVGGRISRRNARLRPDGDDVGRESDGGLRDFPRRPTVGPLLG